MKAPTPIPHELRLVERHTFLASIDNELRPTMRDRSEVSGVHLLALFSDPQDRFVEVRTIGPSGDFTDWREAVRGASTGLSLRYVVPCPQCPPYALPKGCPTTGLPLSLLKLLPPPRIPDGGSAEPRKVPAPPAPPAKPSLRMDPSPFAMTLRPREDEAAEGAFSGGSGAPPVVNGARGLQEWEANLLARETALDLREKRLMEMRREFNEEGVRLNDDLTVRENELIRRERSLQAKLDALAEVLREFGGLSAQLEAVARAGADPLAMRAYDAA